MTGPRFWRGAVLGLSALAIFSALFSMAAWRHMWPELPPGAFHNTDQSLGLAGGLVILFLLLRPARNARTGTAE